MKSKKRFIVILADGARYDIFAELLSAGALPHFEELFLNEGNFAKATSVFPSTTGPAYMPFLTGCYPGTCNVPGIRWFDKDYYARTKFSLKRFRSYVGFESFLMNRDMHDHYKTLFEIFPKSYNIFSSVNRGVPSNGNISSHMRVWYWYYAHLTDRWDLVDKAALEKSLQVIKSDFEFLFVVFPAIDEFSHMSHPRHSYSLKAYQNIDKVIGQLRKQLIAEAKLDETAVFLVSDHGLSETREHFGVASHLESKGLKTFYYPKIFKKNFDAASMVSGNAMLHLYFKRPQGWEGRMSYEEFLESYSDLYRDLCEHRAVDLLIMRDLKGNIKVSSSQGQATVSCRNEKLYYHASQGDPLDLGVAKADFSFEDSLIASENSRYPDGLMQLEQIFRSPRTGDVVLSAQKGFDLRKRFEHPEHKSSHGALHDEHILTPLFSSVPMKKKLVRSVDLFPSILQLAEKPPVDKIDGLSFL